MRRQTAHPVFHTFYSTTDSAKSSQNHPRRKFSPFPPPNQIPPRRKFSTSYMSYTANPPNQIPPHRKFSTSYMFYTANFSTADQIHPHRNLTASKCRSNRK